MTSISQELWDEIVAERGPQCELCHWRMATQKHHCIVKRKKGHPEFDCKENIEITCDECHIWGDGYINSYEHKVGFWNKQVARGYDMRKFYDSLNLKVRENFG